MKIAVTGATGFLGRHIVAELLDGYRVIAISRSGGMPPGLSSSIREGVEPVSADVLDEDSLTRAFEGAGAVVHSAGRVSHDPVDAEEMWQVHVQGSLNVLRAARRAGLRRLVHLSSSGAVGVSREPRMHDEKGAPPLDVVQTWPYYRAKLFSEQQILDEARDLEVVVLNPSLLLGPGDDARGLSTGPVRIFLDGGVPLSPPGTVSFVDVRDVADAVKRSLRRGQPGQRYLLGGANMSFHQLYSRLARISGKPAPAAAMPRAFRKVLGWFPGLGRDDEIGFGVRVDRHTLDLACHHWAIDWSRAERELGWAPRDPQQTLEDTVFDILERKEAAARRYSLPR